VETLEVVSVIDETGLVSQAQAGDRDAFSELVRRYRIRVINVVYQMCGDVNLAEDAAQEAFIRTWQHLPDFQLRSSFRNWLYRIAVNTALDIARRERPDADVESLELAAPGENLEADLEKRERLRQIHQAVLGLPQASRAVLILREYEGLSYREIAETLDISVGTVMSRLNYARTHLAKTLRPLMEAT